MLERIYPDKSWDKQSKCLNPEHEPPKHIVLEPGTYRYECPSCGKAVEFTIPQITC